mmetsp:Transcript_29595/g.54306  ORF Transcript_29595/g.54306 Transcript_29595/m.54306 type:complete len:645 (+) Transcript_29595:239-2173(+)
MIGQLNIPPGAKEAALETTEEMRVAAKEVLAQGREVFHSFYSQVSCTDLSAIQASANCAPLKAGGGAHHPPGSRDGEGAITLDWRADPFVSMSDLTLVVYDGTRNGGAEYHVHTLLLAYGGRKSGFVAEQIKCQQNKSTPNKKKNNNQYHHHHDNNTILRQNSSNSDESNNNNINLKSEYRVEIYVPSLAARTMPLFLDYIYGITQLKPTTSTAPPLRYLSNRFDVRELHREISLRFIPRDLELNTAPRYCTLADELKDFEMRDGAIRIMAERFERMNNVGLLRGMSPKLMRSLVQCERLVCGSEMLSEKVAMYLRMRDDDELVGDDHHHHDEREEENQVVVPLTDEDYYWLTHCAHMPKISPKEALFYFNYGTRYPQVMNEIGSGSLKSRCLAACSDIHALDELTTHLENNNNTITTTTTMMELYDNLEPKMKIQLLESSLVGARKLMVDKERQSGIRNERDRDVELSDRMMYERNNCKKESLSKVVVLGCGVASANGLYLCRGGSNNNNNSNNIISGNKSDPGQYSNGSHRRTADNDNNVVTYEKEAVWNQQHVTFLLYPTTSGKYYTQYKLAVVVRRQQRQQSNTSNGNNNNNPTSSSRRRVLYNSPTVMATNSGNVIPELAWEVEEDGGSDSDDDDDDDE